MIYYSRVFGESKDQNIKNKEKDKDKKLKEDKKGFVVPQILV